MLLKLMPTIKTVIVDSIISVNRVSEEILLPASYEINVIIKTTADILHYFKTLRST